MRLGLGTVQFGLDYGVSNKGGRTPLPEAERILALAAANGIEVLDTAALYGDSEALLGEAIPAKHSFRIVTKSPSFKAAAISAADTRQLSSVFHRSLERLRQDRVYCLLIHHADDLLVPGGIRLVEEMQRLVEQGLVDKIGVSVYDGRQIDRVLDLFTPDIVQLPVNIFDQRLVECGRIAQLAQLGIEVHARSIFLQGLLLMSVREIPDFLSPFASHFQRYTSFLEENRFSPLEAALCFIKSVIGVHTAIVGVCSVRELEQILGIFEGPTVTSVDFRSLSTTDERLVNPSLWNSS